MFPSTDLGDLSWYLGCAFERNLDKGTLRMSQSAFIDSMVSRFEIETESELPAFTTGDLGPKRDDEADCDMPVKAAVGCLLWVAGNTRPDVANPVRAIARHSHNPSPRHWKGLRKIMGYLKGTRDLGIVFRRGGGLKLSLYVDADYADKANDRRSVSGAAVMLGGSVVSATSTTQHCTTLSTSEAEYVAMAHGVKNALFSRAVLEFVQPQLCGMVFKVFEDNEGAKALAENPLSSARTKHIDVRYHFLRELVKRNEIAIRHVQSKDQHADILTKPLGRDAFSRHRRFLMNLSG